MNPLTRKLAELKVALEKELNADRADELEEKIERLEHELKHPVHVEATLEEDSTD